MRLAATDDQIGKGAIDHHRSRRRCDMPAALVVVQLAGGPGQSGVRTKMDWFRPSTRDAQPPASIAAASAGKTRRNIRPSFSLSGPGWRQEPKEEHKHPDAAVI
jgi:hypothetical protein